ncbi:MAG: hypothetical protein ACREVN_01170 [Gammaproteobacteria bacterium]
MWESLTHARRRIARTSCRGLRLPLSLIGAFSVLAPASSLAQPGTVWSGNSSNNRIYTVDFDTGTTTVVNTDANIRKGIDALALIDRGSERFDLIVGDPSAGELVIYAGAQGVADVIIDQSSAPGTFRPSGISLDAGNNLLFLSTPTGASGDNRVWALLRDTSCPDPARPECLAGGFRLPLGSIDSDVRVGGQPVAFGDSILVPSTGGGLNAGDFLVVSSQPGAVLRYRAADLLAFLNALPAATPPEITADIFIPPGALPAGAALGGIEFGPDGNLLLTTTSGDILRYDRDGDRLLPNFADALGNGQFNLAVGVQGASNKAFVAFRNGGLVLRFGINADGTGTLETTVTSGVQFPVDVVTSTSNTVISPAGAFQTVAATPVLESLIDRVLDAGVTSVSVLTFPDPRVADGVFVPGSFSLDSIDSTLPAITVEDYTRAFPDRLGVDTFVLVQVDKTYEVSGIVQSFGNEDLVTGTAASCTEPDPTSQPQMFWHPSPGETSAALDFPEKGSFSNITFGCGSSRGMGRDTSEFLLNTRDTRAPVDIAAFQLTNLGTVLQQDGGCMSARVSRSLSRAYDRAERNFSRGQFGRAQSDLASFETIVDTEADAFTGCTTNVAGDLRSRALAITFQIQRHLIFSP